MVTLLHVVLACSSASSCWRWPVATDATQFYAGWLTEYSLSVDNLFVFVIIMSASRCRGNSSRRR